ncbi:hypothetical protein WN55_05371 [Dufourea novaeangliae]|uniref:C2H2-type domain-containing protein n=1 Tax=Dufourea novaeangliae TaxID=178035 RepID=A0A154PMQ7_DUFNO|nr:hypothetical protein WN55_05371 [Dufourea novaeangliae]
MKYSLLITSTGRLVSVAAPGFSSVMHGNGLMSLHVEGGTQVQVPRSLMQAFLQQDPNHPGLETVRLPTPQCGSDEAGPPPHCREVETELCLVCRRCGRAYPQESTLLAHQRSCYLGNQQRRGALRLGLYKGYKVAVSNNSPRYPSNHDAHGASGISPKGWLEVRKDGPRYKIMDEDNILLSIFLEENTNIDEQMTGP